MKNLIFSILLLFLLSSCKTECKFKHENFVLNFPMTVKEAKENLGLTYGYYNGFYREQDNNSYIRIQLDNQPIFLGSDNDHEEDYLNRKVVGVTFIYPIDIFSTDSLRNNIEKIYSTKFESISTLKDVDYAENVDTMTFYKSIIDESITLIIKEKYYRLLEEKYTSLTVYYNLNENELIEFVSSL